MKNLEQLIDEMIYKGVLHSQNIIDAFKYVDRINFVPSTLKDKAYIDAPLPIGQNQTISQPSTVAFMLELLNPKKSQSILDIGSGSGWTTALLCKIVGDDGEVIGLERVDDLVDVGKKNLAKFNFSNRCQIKKASKKLGIEGRVFDKILVSASAKNLPRELFNQLKIGGTLVIPIQNSIFKFTKIDEDQIQSSEYPGFVFVPLIES